MLKQKLFVAIIISLGFILQACSQDSIEPEMVTEQTISQKTSQMVSGTITSVNHVSRDSRTIFEVRVTTIGGGVIKFEYLSASGELLEIKGLSGPFDYELNPGSQFIPYSAARKTALNAKPGTINEWSLEFDQSNQVWEYRFRIQTADKEWKVRINAVTGGVLRIQ